MSTLTYTDNLTVLACGGCHITFAMPTDMYTRRLDDHETFYCPNGHSRAFTGPSKATRLQAQLDQMKADRDYWLRARREELERLTAEKRKHAATKGQLTKTRKRAEHGVCLHCKRSFANVARHVAHMHPEVSKP